MTIAQQPWHCTHYTASPGAALKNATGQTIALFNRYEDATYVVDMSKKIEELEKQIEELEDKKKDVSNV